MAQLFIAVVSVLIAVSAFAADLTFEPAEPREGESFVIRIAGVWPDSCPPSTGTIRVGGRVIVAEFRLCPSGTATPEPTAFIAQVTAPGLTGGTYSVEARALDPARTRSLASSRVTVTPGWPPLSLWPTFGDSRGGNVVRIFGPFGCSSGDCGTPEVWFGDHKTHLVRADETAVIARVPPGAEGFVQVRVRFADREWKLPNAYQFLSTDHYVPFLVPISFVGAVGGFNGSSWYSWLSLHNGEEFRLIDDVDILGVDNSCRITCLPPPPFAPGLERGFNVSGGNGVPAGIVYLHRSVATHQSFQSRVYDLSRQLSTWGTELPVIRVPLIPRQRVLRLIDVPLGGDFRVMLRVYGAGPRATHARVRFEHPRTGAVLSDRVMDLGPLSREPLWPFQTEPYYLELGAIQNMPELAGVSTVRVEIESVSDDPVWAFASITHNETQHVTLVTPQF